MRAIYRFTRDLRLEDHAGLAAVAGHGEVVPAFVLDAELERTLRASTRRAAFFCGSLASLENALRERGSHLVVRRGDAATVLPELARETGATAIGWSAGYDAQAAAADRRLQAAVEEAGFRALAVHDSPAVPPEETSAARPSGGSGYRAFVPYYDVWQTIAIGSYEAPLLLSFARTSLQSEPLPRPEDFGSSREAEGGNDRAKERLERFLSRDALEYPSALDEPASDRTSHVAADLTFGTIAARTIVRETKRRLEDPFLLAEERNALKLFLRSLALRDFFLQLAWYYPETSTQSLQTKMRSFSFAQDHPALEAWRAGRTGYPIVDAGIRQLRATGWMHPRVRSIAASFLCFDLGVDWRIGIVEWDQHLVEDDPALAVGNWQWIAGVGADLAAYPRIYNPERQAARYDPRGAYARRWIEELAHVPAGLFTPSRMESSQIGLALYAQDSYPAPVIDHASAARDFLARYEEFQAAAGAESGGEFVV